MSDQPQKNINSAVGVIATGLNLFGLNKKSKNEDQLNKNSENIKKNKDKLIQLENTIDENKNKIEKIIKETKEDYLDGDDGLLVQMENKIKEEFKTKIDSKKNELINNDSEIEKNINDESYRANEKYLNMEKDIESYKTQMETDYSTLNDKIKETQDDLSLLTETLNNTKNESMENEYQNMYQGNSVYQQHGKQNTVRITGKEGMLNNGKVLTGWLWRYNGHLYVVTTGREWEENIYDSQTTSYDADAVIYNSDTNSFQHFYIKMCSVDFLNNVSLFGFVDEKDENTLLSQQKGLDLDSEIHKGERCYLVGELGEDTDHFSITSGIVKDDNFTNTGNDSILLDMVSGLTGSFGSPFLNKNGKVIGMKQNSTLYFPRFGSSFTGDINKVNLDVWGNDNYRWNLDTAKMEEVEEDGDKPKGIYLNFDYYPYDPEGIDMKEIVSNNVGLKVSNMGVYSGGKITECKKESSIPDGLNLIQYIDNVIYSPNIPTVYPELVTTHFETKPDKTLSFLFNPNLTNFNARREKFQSEFIIKIRMETDSDGNNTFVFAELFCYKSLGSFSNADGFGCGASSSINLVKFNSGSNEWENEIGDNNEPITITNVSLFCWFEGIKEYEGTFVTNLDNFIPKSFLTPMINYDINGTYKYKVEDPEIGRLITTAEGYDWISLVKENKTYGSEIATPKKNIFLEPYNVSATTVDDKQSSAYFTIGLNNEYNSKLNKTSDWFSHIKSEIKNFTVNYNIIDTVSKYTGVEISPNDFQDSGFEHNDAKAGLQVEYIAETVKSYQLSETETIIFDESTEQNIDFINFMVHNDDISDQTEIPYQEITYFCQPSGTDIYPQFFTATLSYQQGSWDYEVSLRILDSNSQTVFEITTGNAPESDTNFEIELEHNITYTIQGSDSYGDGWNGQRVTITGLYGNVLLDGWAGPSVSEAETTFTSEQILPNDYVYPAAFTGKGVLKEVEYETYYTTATSISRYSIPYLEFQNARLQFYAISDSDTSINLSFIQDNIETVLGGDLSITTTKTLYDLDLNQVNIIWNTINLTFTPGSYTGEVGFKILDDLEQTLFEITSGNAPTTETTYNILLSWRSAFTLIGTDSYGDGWNGGLLTITDESGNELVTDFTVPFDAGDDDGGLQTSSVSFASPSPGIPTFNLTINEFDKYVSIYGIRVLSNSGDFALLDHFDSSNNMIRILETKTLLNGSIDQVVHGGSQFEEDQPYNIYTQDEIFSSLSLGAAFQSPFTLTPTTDNILTNLYYEIKNITCLDDGNGFTNNEEITINSGEINIVLNPVNRDNGYLILEKVADTVNSIEILSYANSGFGYIPGDEISLSSFYLDRDEGHDLIFSPLTDGVNFKYFPKLSIKLPDLPSDTELIDFQEEGVQRAIDNPGDIDLGIDSSQVTYNSIFTTQYNTTTRSFTLNQASATSGTFGISSSILEKILIKMVTSPGTDIIQKNLRLKTRYNMNYILPEEINSFVQKKYMEQASADYILGKSSITINDVTHYHIGGLYMSISYSSANPFYIYDRYSSNIPIKEKDFILFRVKYKPNQFDPNYSDGKNVSFPIGTFNSDCKSLSSIIQFINKDNLDSLEFHGLECTDIDENNNVTWEITTKPFTLDDIEFSDYHDLQYLNSASENYILN